MTKTAGTSIPDAALDDRLGFVGITGSGKTYAAGVLVEKLLYAKARCIILDPLDVWWGLRLQSDGERPSRFNPVILGGAHADLPLNERAGALIGETIARAAESFIISTSLLETIAAERRFMLSLLTALYRHAGGELLHLIVDEADQWAPQQILDREGEAAKLLGQMERIVRRGRIKGFVPWLITQRPAVLNKNVLSQIDGLVALKLTSSQDRDAIGEWVKGQADRELWANLWKALPAMSTGQGFVWLPGRNLLDTVPRLPDGLTPRLLSRVQAAALLRHLAGAFRCDHRQGGPGDRCRSPALVGYSRARPLDRRARRRIRWQGSCVDRRPAEWPVDWSRPAAAARRASGAPENSPRGNCPDGLKIRVSVVQFRPWAPANAKA